MDHDRPGNQYMFKPHPKPSDKKSIVDRNESTEPSVLVVLESLDWDPPDPGTDEHGVKLLKNSLIILLWLNSKLAFIDSSRNGFGLD